MCFFIEEEFMSVDRQKQQIQAYFKVWLDRDIKALNQIFSKDVYYAECMGPEYRGLYQVEEWIKFMFNKQIVLKWDIHEMIPSYDQKQITVIWTFSCEEDKIYTFDGVSLIKFDDEDRILSITEYEALKDKETPKYITEIK